MQTADWKRVKELLEEVLPLDAAARRERLESADVSSEIRAEVESLLIFEEESADLMNLSAVEFLKDSLDEIEEKSDFINQRIGVYEIVREIGYGGMGVVYLARRSDGKFEQTVALKLLKREMNTGVLRRRFEQEREILAALEHPNIARLLDAGTTGDNVPYLAMEFVEGLPIDIYCERKNLKLNERLELFRKVCRAVGYAHRRLIVHRDLKPSNILITDDETPKLLDFGISKILSAEFDAADAATVTKLGAMTPGYASPEQLQNKSVTTATDIYSLGVILYELLSGHRPFEAREENLKEIYHAVVELDPPPPSALVETNSKAFKKAIEARAEIKSEEFSDLPTVAQNAENQTASNKSRATLSSANLNSNNLRGDLDNIVLKSLRKEPERRYSSAEDFSEDIRRHLEGLPVAARPNTFAYRAEKFVKRNLIGVIAVALILLAVIAGVAATLWQARIARIERARAEKRFQDVRTLANSFLFEFSPKIENLAGSTPARELLVRRALEYLDSLSQESGDDTELQRELAKAYEKVGDVQGNPNNPNIGDTSGALKSYEKARVLQENLLAKEPENVERQSDLANLYELLGALHLNGGENDQGKVFYDQSLVLREKILAQKPTDFEARAKLARIIKLRGLIPFFEGDNKKAVEFYERSQQIYRELLAEQPNNDEIAHEHAYNFVSIGEAQGWDGETEIAGASIQKGLEMLIPISAKYPNNQTLQRSLHLAYYKRAENYEDAEDYKNAAVAYNKSLDIARAAMQSDAQSAQAKRDFALTNKKLAGALSSDGKGVESLEKLNVALEMFQAMMAADPANTERPYDVANTRITIGETLLTMKNYAAALEIFQTSQREFEAVLATSPNNIYAKRMLTYNFDRLGKSYAALAETKNRRENLENALTHFRRALDDLNLLKAAGNLGEIDNESFEEFAKEIADTEAKIEKL